MNGESVKVASDGTFNHTVKLREGINLINVESTDSVGNTVYGKRLVTYKGSKRSRTAGVSGNQ